MPKPILSSSCCCLIHHVSIKISDTLKNLWPIYAARLAPTINIFTQYLVIMNRKTILAFSIVSTVALVLLIAFAPVVETHQAHAFWGGYYGGGWPG
jgi:hypothetical protein